MDNKIAFGIIFVVLVISGFSTYVLYKLRTEANRYTINELKIAISTDITTIDINYATGVSDFEVLGKVYESLFRIDYNSTSKKLIYIPWLVKSYIQVNDTYWLFTLKNNIKFHNNEELTAWDVKASIERAMSISPIGKMLLRDAYGNPIIENIVVYNATVFAVKLKTPFTPLIEHLAHLAIAIMPRDIAEKYRDRKIESLLDVVGTGPYRITEYVRGQYIKLQRFDQYWNGKRPIESIEYMIIPDHNTRIAALETGQADIAVGIPPDMVSRLASKGFKIYNETGVRLVIAAINTERIPDIRIRQAMNYAINKKAIVDRVLNGYAIVANSIASPIFPGVASLEEYIYSPEKAERLIEEAGGLNKTLTLLTSTRSPKDIEVAQIIQSYLSEVGIKIEIQTMEHTAFLKKVFTDHDFDLAIYGPSPSSLYYALTYWRTGAALNAPLYSNSKVDQLLNEVARERDIDRRIKMYRDIQEIIWSECPAIWLYYENVIVAAKPGLVGLKILPFQMLILDNLYVKG